MRETAFDKLFILTTCLKDPDVQAGMAAKNRWDSLGKPLHSFGKLENAVIKMAMIQETPFVCMDKKAIVVFCGDHGVVEEHVTQTDSSVTRTVAENMARGQASVAIMAEQAGADLYIVDVGMKDGEYEDTFATGKVIGRKIAAGTKNITKEPAMTRDQCAQAVMTGVEVCRELENLGYDCAGVGEMGIGNTTASSAIAGLLLDLPAETVTGRGAGLSDEGYKAKIDAVKRAQDRYWKYTADSEIPRDPAYNLSLGLEVMSQLGGYELAAITGMCLGAAVYKIPVILDGFITTTAALDAKLISPVTSRYLLASHVSAEPAGLQVLKALGLDPVINAGMFCGEGTGAAAAMKLYEMGLAEYSKMGSFSDIHVKPYEDYAAKPGTEK